MTELQARCLDAIRRLTVGGVAPSYTELQHEVGVASRSNIFRLVQALADQGHLVVTYGKWRSLRVVDPALNPDRLAAMETSELQGAASHITRILHERGAL